MIRVVIGAVSLNVGLPCAAQAVSTLDKIKERGYIIAGSKEDCAPFGFRDKTGDIVGFDVDICRYIANKLGVELKVVPVTSAIRVTAVQNETIDISAATITHTKSRDKVIDFSITYFLDGQKFLVKKGSGIRSYRDLAGKRICTVRATTSERRAKELQPQAKVISFNSYRECFVALKNGVVDAFTTDSTILLGFKASEPDPENYEIVGKFLSEEPYGLGLLQNDSKWRDFVNNCLIEMWNKGEWLKIYNKWFGPGQKYEYSLEELDFKMSTWPLR
ncbi:MAG: ABC transporter substrate-binding protein [bacterium]|nr:MAG: ABC transporter substrate-binding protein [bacterium]